MPRKNLGNMFVVPMVSALAPGVDNNRNGVRENLSVTQDAYASILKKTNFSRDHSPSPINANPSNSIPNRRDLSGNRPNHDSQSPGAEKRNSSFNHITSNYDKLYNKRVAASPVNEIDDDYIDKQIKIERTALPAPH